MFSSLLLSQDNIKCNWIYTMFNRLWTIQPRLMLPIKFWGNNGWLALVGKLEITICSSWVPTIDQITHPEGIYRNQPQEEGFLTRTRLQLVLKKNAWSCLFSNMAKSQTVASPLLSHWRYSSLAWSSNGIFKMLAWHERKKHSYLSIIFITYVLCEIYYIYVIQVRYNND